MEVRSETPVCRLLPLPLALVCQALVIPHTRILCNPSFVISSLRYHFTLALYLYLQINRQRDTSSRGRAHLKII